MYAESKSDLPSQLRAKAEALQPQIDAKMDPAIGRQRLTRRRDRIAFGMREDGRRLERVQNALRAIAEGHESGTLPDGLRHVRFKSHVEEVLCEWKPEHADARAWLKGHVPGASPADVAAERIRELERQLIGRKIDGFFPTPAAIVEEMILRAEIMPGHEVLEPSAGKGDIAEAIRQACPEATLQVVEINPTLRELLTAKGFELVADDFLKCGGTCDRIVMNPPFERGLDIEHVLHAFACLVPGGRLVSIMSEGPFCRSDRKSIEFRAWLDAQDSTAEQLPPGSFAGADSFRQTGVNVRLVTIRKRGA